MPELIDPAAALRPSFLAAVQEFRSDSDYPTPWFVHDVDAQGLVDPEAFGRYVARLLREATQVDARSWFVPMTTLWWVESDRFLGRLAIRHRLTPALEEAGGHIGYDVRPSARRQGHATAMLSQALPIARTLGISEALVMCDRTNIASQRAIEANGGRLWDITEEKRRYWVPTQS